MDSLTEEESERYARHIILPEIGGAGQQKLKAARILVLGIGGLGSAIIAYLAAMGVGTLGLVDGDHVSLSNLQRQIIHGTDAIGKDKTASAKRAVKRINPHVKIEEHSVWLDSNNADGMIAAYDMILDGSDNAATRYLVADAAARQHKPLISGAIQRFDGSLTVLMPYRDNNPSYRDLFPQPKNLSETDSCAQMGVAGALPGIIGSLQAMEAIKLICNIGEPLVGRLLLYDALNARFDIIHYKKNAKHQNHVSRETLSQTQITDRQDD